MTRLFFGPLVLASLAACGGSPRPSQGVSEAAAVAAATALFPDSTGVESTTAGRIQDFEPAQGVVPGDTWVWVVVLSGSFQPAKTRTVVLDYRSGAFIMWSSQSG
ncbi:MAG: hypothetical protein ABI555_09325 [Chloroflexota bacterium]